MKKSFSTTFILFLVLGGLIAWYTLYEKKYKGKLTEKEENAKKLITLKSDEIQEVTIVRMKNPPTEASTSTAPADYETIKLTKSGTDWQVVEPTKDAADSTNITSTLSVLTSSKEERIVDENPKDLAAYGLKEPVAKVTLKRDGTTEELWIGGNTPVGFSSYAKLANKPQIYKISRSVRTNFEKDANQYRNKSLIAYKREDVGEIEIQLAKENIVLKKGTGDAWVLARDGIPVDVNELGKTLNGLTDLKAVAIVSDSPSNLSEYGLTQPHLRATLQKAKEGTRFQVVIGKGAGKNKDKYFARREDRLTVYEIAKTSVDPLERPSTAYRNLKIATLNRFNAKLIKFEKGDASFELSKNDIGWQFNGDTATKIDGSQVDALLTRLQDTKLVRYLTQKSHPSLKEPKLTLHVSETKDKQEVETVLLTFGVPTNKEVIVKSKDLDLLFAIKEEDFVKLNSPKTSFVQADKKPEEPKAPEKKSE